MSIDKLSNKQINMDRKTHSNIKSFEVEEQEGPNSFITSDDQPIINNKFEEQQVCIDNSIVR